MIGPRQTGILTFLTGNHFLELHQAFELCDWGYSFVRGSRRSPPIFWNIPQMENTHLINLLAASGLSLGLAIPSAALAYGKNDAIRDFEQRIRSEYSLSD
ncbi:MAG: hypothetical protein WBM40_13170, partial [Thiohalocapsa sp.]